MDSHEREAEWLLSEKYHDVADSEYERDVASLKSGTPLAYLIGHVPFLGATIFLDSKPLIPRVETEYWVAHVIERYKSKPPARGLDLCAGSGCIGVAILKAFPACHVDLVEIDMAHHATIEKNVRENGIARERVHILGGDLFEHVSGQYDLILTNPPYIGTDAHKDVAESVLAHEPHSALFAGHDGLDIIRRIIVEAPAHLAPGGLLSIEHEPYQGVTISVLAETASFMDIQTQKDQYGVERVTHMYLQH